MASYEERINKVKTNIIKSCRECIEENFHELNMWLSFEGWVTFTSIYEHEFEKQFEQYLDSETEGYITFAALNLNFAIAAYKTRSLNELLTFVEAFIENQIEDFDNWGENVCMAMPDESAEENPT